MCNMVMYCNVLLTCGNVSRMHASLPCCRYVLAHLHFLDMDGDGLFSFSELVHCLSAIDLKLPSNTLLKGGVFRKRARKAGPATVRDVCV